MDITYLETAVSIFAKRLQATGEMVKRLRFSNKAHTINLDPRPGVQKPSKTKLEASIKHGNKTIGRNICFSISTIGNAIFESHGGGEKRTQTASACSAGIQS